MNIAELFPSRIALKIPFAKKDMAKAIHGYEWDHPYKIWHFPMAQSQQLRSAFPELTYQIEENIRLYKDDNPDFEEKEDFPPVKVEDHIKGVIVDQHFKLKPFKHQIDMLKCGLKYDKFAYFCEMGTGKSKVIVDIVNAIGPAKALVVCPKTVMASWVNEVNMNADIFEPRVYSRNKRKKFFEREQWTRTVDIINYEGLLSIGESEEWDKYHMVVLDESTRIKNPKAKITKFCLKAFAKTKYKYILSGRSRHSSFLICTDHSLIICLSISRSLYPTT